VPDTQYADLRPVYLHETISLDLAVYHRLHQLHGSLLDEMRAMHQELRSKRVPMHM
jgi:hypothetical protein